MGSRTWASVIHNGQCVLQGRNHIFTEICLETLYDAHELTDIRNMSDRACGRQAENTSKRAVPIRRKIYGGSSPASGYRRNSRLPLRMSGVVQGNNTFKAQKIYRVKNNIRLADKAGGILW